MSSLRLISERQEYEIPGSYLIVGLDETGHEWFADRNCPIFGIGGCAVRASEYEYNLKVPWQKVRAEIFPGLKGPLHAAQIGQLPLEKAAILGDFFTKGKFGRLATVVSNRALLEDDLPPYRIVARKIIDQISRFVSRFKCDGVVIIIEESERTDVLAAAFFEGYDIMLSNDFEPRKIPFLKFRMPKKAAEPLLEVADFIVHVAGLQVRDVVYHGREWGQRRDFRTVFLPESELGDSRVEFFEIIAARYVE